MIFMRDQTITGSANIIHEVQLDTSTNSTPSNEVNISPANPLKIKNNIGIEKENRNTFLNLDLTSLTSLLLCAFANSGNKISRLAAKS